MGYKKVYMPNHPHAMKDGCVYEHRLIMEGLLGRHLLPEEQVHHEDENKENNNEKNLVLCPTPKDHSQEHAYDDDHLIELLIRHADVVGFLPSKRQCDNHPELPSSSTYVSHFGTWSKAKQLAQNRIEQLNYEEAL